MQFDQSLVTDYWHLLCHRSELPRSGDYIRFETVVGDLVVLNDGAGIIVFDNLCPHRGARFYNEPSGNQQATCSYHGWTHKAGRMFIAGKERFAACDLSQAEIRQFSTEWMGDFLFACISPRMTLAEQVGSLADKLLAISSNIFERADFNHYTYECYWPLAIENALEPYHIDLIHPGTLATLKLDDGVNVFHDWSSVWSAELGNRKSSRQLSSIRSFFEIEKQFQGYESIYLFPFTMISSTFGYSYSLQNFFPFSSMATSFYSRLLVSRSVSERAGRALQSFFTSTAEVNRKVFAEDHSICRQMPRQAWSIEPLLFAADNEEKVQHFRQMCRKHCDVSAVSAIGTDSRL